MPYIVTGADRETGESRTVTVHTDSRADAERNANNQGVLIEDVKYVQRVTRRSSRGRRFNPYVVVGVAIGLIAGYFVGREHLKYEIKNTIKHTFGGLLTPANEAQVDASQIAQKRPIRLLISSNPLELTKTHYFLVDVVNNGHDVIVDLIGELELLDVSGDVCARHLVQFDVSTAKLMNPGYAVGGVAIAHSVPQPWKRPAGYSGVPFHVIGDPSNPFNVGWRDNNPLVCEESSARLRIVYIRLSSGDEQGARPIVPAFRNLPLGRETLDSSVIQDHNEVMLQQVRDLIGD